MPSLWIQTSLAVVPGTGKTANGLAERHGPFPPVEVHVWTGRHSPVSLRFATGHDFSRVPMSLTLTQGDENRAGSRPRIFARSSLVFDRAANVAPNAWDSAPEGLRERFLRVASALAVIREFDRILRS